MAEQIKVGYGPRAIAIDSFGNARLANTLGHPGAMQELALTMVWVLVRLSDPETFGTAGISAPC
jgi:hypothetical protein